jgi:uncharacterized protein YceH (UPF0502 family)
LKHTITPVEARVLGCLIEKEATTPDVYPMTLNGLLVACNQKSSRDPVMSLTEAEVQTALDSLIDHTLASTWNTNRNRMPKYRHCLHDRISEEFNFSREELAVLATLLLRGAQTVGEVRTRCARIHEFPDLETVQALVTDLESDRRGGPYVALLPRQPGRKEARIAHLFCGAPEVASPSTAVSSPTAASPPPGASSGAGGASAPTQLEALEGEVAELKSRIRELEERFEAFTSQFD